MKDKVIEGIVKEAGEKGLYIIYAQLRRGGKITEEFNRAKNKTRLNTFSISKSFVSAGIGIAMDEGLLTMDERICDAFEEYVPSNASKNLLDTRVRHMLTMTTGLNEPLFFADGPERYKVKDWIAHFFNADRKSVV